MRVAEEAAQRAYERLTARLSETGSRGSRLRRIEEADAAVMTGTAMGLFYALLNGLGRT